MAGASLPLDFPSLIAEHLGSVQAESLCEALLHSEPTVSVRLNTRKLASLPAPLEIPPLGEEVPWCPDAYYLPTRPSFISDPLFHAGAYYVQEASSMYLAQVLRTYLPQLSSGEPCQALDLCAAPGGKSTLLASLLPERSLLIGNEPVAKRAYILAENMAKWTWQMPRGEYPVRTVVTQQYPDHFHSLKHAFDLVLTDVPCSGEGMFRKDPQAIADWSLDNVAMCASRQREILQSVWPALRPGGLLVYSTCTFNRFEDEDNARYVASTLGGTLLHERHFFPGRDRGEGFYIAAVRKDGEGVSHHTLSPERLTAAGFRVLYHSEKDWPREAPRVELDAAEALQYLRREAVRKEAPRGSLMLTHRGLLLGPGKGVGSRINNLYPAEWRIRTTYTKPFSLF